MFESNDNKRFTIRAFTKDTTYVNFKRSFDRDLDRGEILENHGFDNDATSSS